MDTNQILDAIDKTMEMVLESDGRFNRNQIIIPIEIQEKGSFELVIIFKKKDASQ